MNFQSLQDNETGSSDAWGEDEENEFSNNFNGGEFENDDHIQRGVAKWLGEAPKRGLAERELRGTVPELRLQGPPMIQNPPARAQKPAAPTTPIVELDFSLV